MNEKRYYFSLATGEIYQIEKEDIPVLFEYQIPLLKRPSSSCKGCYGRGSVGQDSVKKFFHPCKCLEKVIDNENFKKNHVQYQAPRIESASVGKSQ